MASVGANWKRPWQDDDRPQAAKVDSSERSPAASDDLLASGSRGPREATASTADSTGTLNTSTDSPLVVPKQSTSHDQLNGSAESYGSARQSPILSSKRARLGESPAQDRTFEQASAPRSFQQHNSHRPTGQGGYLESRITDNAPREEMTHRQSLMSLLRPPPPPPPPPPPHEPIPPIARDMSTMIGIQNMTREVTNRECPVCDKAQTLAPQIAKGLQRLHRQLRHVLDRGKSGATSQAISSPEAGLPPTPEKLIEALDYSIDKLNDNMKVAKDMLYNLNLDDRPSNEGYGNQAPYGERQSARWEQGDQYLARSSRASPRGSEENLRQQDHPSRKDTLYQGLPYGSHLGRPNSPNRNLQTLPSPPGTKFTTSAGLLPPMSPSVVGPNGQSPHVAHLQDLQHQLSTKSLAHQILQGEHEKLLAAYSRSQSKCAALDKKAHVSDTEINNLTEDRIRLQGQIEAFEQQVEELQQSRDEAHKQSVAKGSQYMQIMAMSSKLQAQSASDLKKWKTDRDDWSKEKDDLVTRIASLEKSAGQILRHDISHGANGDSEGAENEEAELSGMSFERLKEEIMSLRRGKREAESLVQALRDEGGAIRKLTEELSSAGERLTRIGMGEPMQTE